MSQQKVHQLLMLFLVSCIAVMLVLLLVEPIFGILWMLLIALVCVLLAISKPAIWRMEKERIARLGRRIKNMLAGDSEDYGFHDRDTYELVVVQPNRGQRFSVSKKAYLIGRGAECDCRLIGADTVGREHCRIVYREHSREYYIEDLRSKNGTYLGTSRLEPNTQVKLLENAEIFIGGYCLRFEKKQGS